MMSETPTRQEILTTEVNKLGLDYYKIAADILNTAELSETLHQLNKLIKDADMTTEQEVNDAFAFIFLYEHSELALQKTFCSEPFRLNMTPQEQKIIQEYVFNKLPKMTEELAVFLVQYTGTMIKILREEQEDAKTKANMAKKEPSKYQQKYGKKK